MPGKASAPVFYRVTFQLLTVVFDIVGYVAETDFLDIDPGDDLKRAMLPLWPSEHPDIWWPPIPKIFTRGLRLVTASAGCSMPEA